MEDYQKEAPEKIKDFRKEVPAIFNHIDKSEESNRKGAENHCSSISLIDLSTREKEKKNAN